MSTLSVLCIGDPHFKKDNKSRTDILISSCLELVDSRKPDLVVVMGDTLDRFSDIKTEPLVSAVDFLASLSKRVKTFLLIGNHDLPSNTSFMCKKHPFTALKNWGSRMVVVDEVTVASVKSFALVFSPYVATDRFFEALDTLEDWRYCDVVFAHQEINGCRMGAVVSQSKDVWTADCPLLISGHIHDHMRLGPNVIYTGAPMQHSHGDSKDKSVSLFTFSRGAKGQLQHREERVRLNIPHLEAIRIKATDVFSFVPPTPAHLVKIVILGTQSENATVRRAHKDAEWKRQGYRVSFKDINDGLLNITPDAMVKESFESSLRQKISDDSTLTQLLDEVLLR